MRDETNFITKGQYQKFIDSIPKLKMYVEPDPVKKPKLKPHELQLLFKVIYEGALRVSEAIRLKAEDVLEQDRLLRLENTKGSKSAKRKQRREFTTLTKQTFSELLEYSQKKSGYLFPYTRSHVWKLGKDIGEMAGIELSHTAKDTRNMTVHTLRHSRAVHYVAAKQPINVVQKKLRHRSLQPTTTYTNINLDYLKGVEDEI